MPSEPSTRAWRLKTIDSKGYENGAVIILFSKITEIQTNKVDRGYGDGPVDFGTKIFTSSGREYCVDLSYEVAAIIWLEYLKS